LTPAEEPTQEPTVKAGLSQPARDGKFEFIVTKVAYGKRTVGRGNEFSRVTASGESCVVRVENIGNEARCFDDSSQFLFDQPSIWCRRVLSTLVKSWGEPSQIG